MVAVLSPCCVADAWRVDVEDNVCATLQVIGEQFEHLTAAVSMPFKERSTVMDNDMHTRARVSVPVKLYRTADRLVIAAPMAGVRPEDVSIEVTRSGLLILESRPRGVLRAELFDVEVTVDRDGDEEVWTREQWQDTKEVVLDEWSARGYYRELELPAAVDAALATVTYGNGVLVVSLPVAETVRSARLQLSRVGEGRGQRVDSVGHPG